MKEPKLILLVEYQLFGVLYFVVVVFLRPACNHCCCCYHSDLVITVTAPLIRLYLLF